MLHKRAYYIKDITSFMCEIKVDGLLGKAEVGLEWILSGKRSDGGHLPSVGGGGSAAFRCWS